MHIANSTEAIIVFVKLLAIDDKVAYITVTDFKPPVIARYQP